MSMAALRLVTRPVWPRFVFYDDESDPDTTARLVEKLITEDGVDLLLGPYSSSLTMSASAISEKVRHGYGRGQWLVGIAF